MKKRCFLRSQNRGAALKSLLSTPQILTRVTHLSDHRLRTTSLAIMADEIMDDDAQAVEAASGRKMKGRGHRDPTSLEDRYKDVRFTELEASTGPGPTRSVEGWVVFVTGVNDEAQEEDIHEAFAEFGDIKNIYMNLDRQTVSE